MQFYNEEAYHAALKTEEEIKGLRKAISEYENEVLKLPSELERLQRNRNKEKQDPELLEDAKGRLEEEKGRSMNPYD